MIRHRKTGEKALLVALAFGIGAFVATRPEVSAQEAKSAQPKICTDVAKCESVAGLKQAITVLTGRVEDLQKKVDLAEKEVDRKIAAAVAAVQTNVDSKFNNVRITWHPHWAPTRELCLYGVNEQSAPLFMTCDTEPPRSTFKIRN